MTMILIGGRRDARPAAAGRVYPSFRPSLAVTAATLAFVALTVSLGNWQERRAAEKIALAAQLEQRTAEPALALPGLPVDPQSLQFHRVVARGEYVPGLTFLLDNKVLDGVAGYFVITPLRIENSREYLLVNRGWIAAGARRDLLPEVVTPPGLQNLEGIAIAPTKRFLQLGADGAGKVRENLVVARLATEWRIPLEPVVLQQTSDSADGLVRRWQRPDSGADRNRGYAIQWYSFAALAAILYVALNLKRSRRAG